MEGVWGQILRKGARKPRPTLIHTHGTFEKRQTVSFC